MANIEHPDGTFSIGAASQITGCNVETIRYYERIGVLPAPDRSEGGHRIYVRDDLKRIGFVTRSRSLGFALREIAEFLAQVDRGDFSCAEIKALTLDQIASVKRKIEHLERMQEGLESLAAACDGGQSPDCPIVDALYG